MIRFILRAKRFSEVNGLRTEGLFTLDAECPELEAALREGGQGEQGYHVNELVDAELRALASVPPAEAREVTREMNAMADSFEALSEDADRYDRALCNGLLEAAHKLRALAVANAGGTDG